MIRIVFCALWLGASVGMIAGRHIGEENASARDRALITSLEVMQCTKGPRQ